MRERERIESDLYDSVREAAEVHRQVRAYMKPFIKPGVLLTDMCERLENANRAFIGAKDGDLSRGIAFPTGCSLNNVAAHYSPNKGDKTVLGYDDVMKIDFGTQINGRIIDSAWTVHFNDKYDPLVNAVKAATNEGIKTAGIDVRLWMSVKPSKRSWRAMRSPSTAKTYPIRPCAISAATALGRTNTCGQERAACQGWRFLDRLGEEKYLMGLKSLCDAGVVTPYPPLCDQKGCYTAQFEHTLVLKPTRKE
eukprot:IDg10191t1